MFTREKFTALSHCVHSGLPRDIETPLPVAGQHDWVRGFVYMDFRRTFNMLFWHSVSKPTRVLCLSVPELLVLPGPRKALKW